MARRIEKIVIHCSATGPGHDIGASEIREWHLARGWSDIGYHYVIRLSGEVEEGRKEDLIGAHVRGHNATSVGVCMVGGLDGDATYTRHQWDALDMLVGGLLRRYPDATVCGHRDFPDVHKTCPNFDAARWRG